MTWTIEKLAGLGAASVLAATLLAGPALADGISSHGRAGSGAPTTRPCSTSANVGLTTDYVFRGISQTMEDAAVQGGVDLTCGNWYVGVWGSNVDFGAVGPADTVANVEVDVYAGYKLSTGRISWDAGVIYYAYPGQSSHVPDLDYVELKLAASTQLWKGGTVGGTVFYSPEYTGETGSVWTTEASLSQKLPHLGIFSPTASVLVGHSEFTDGDFEDLSYTYWNAGVTLGFFDKWSLDLRYWDTDGEGFAAGPLGGDRLVGTVKYTF